MGTKILFVNALDCWHTDLQFENASEQLGPLYLVSSLREAFGPDHFEITIADHDIERNLDEFKPDVVGISAVTKNFNIAKRYARAAKSRGSDVLIGGVHISAIPSTLTGDMDVGVIGEGEETIVELMALYEREGSFKNKRALSRIDGIAYRNEGHIHTTQARPPIKPLDRIPFPAWDLSENPTKGILTSRGCPYNCSYCSSKAFWKKVRYHSVEYVVREIVEIIEKCKVNHISIYDDLFASNRKRFRALVDRIKGERIDESVAFNGNVRANEVDEEMAKLLREMNVRHVFLGIESGCQRVLDCLKGGNVTVEQNRRAVGILRKHGIGCTAGIIIGSSEETREEILTTLDFVRSLNLDDLYIFVLTPLPGTPVWEYALERGLVSEDMEWDVLRQEFGEIPEKAVVLSEVLTRDEIYSLYQAFVRHRARVILRSTVKRRLHSYEVRAKRGLRCLKKNPALFCVKSARTMLSLPRRGEAPEMEDSSRSNIMWKLNRIPHRVIYSPSRRRLAWYLLYRHNPLVRKGYPSNDSARRRHELETELNVKVDPIHVDPDEYNRYLSLANYSPRVYGHSFAEKSLEHFLSVKYLDLNKDDVCIDIASANSPFPQIVKNIYKCTVYKQDLCYPLGIDGDKIGGNAAGIPLPDGSISKMTLHCSFEHFEGHSDTLFMQEADRLLKKAGKLCILPLYFADEYTILTDPSVDRRGVVWDKGAVVTNVYGWGSRFGRFYSVSKFRERVLDHCSNLSLRILWAENEKTVDRSCYVKFIAIFEKN